MCFNLEDADLRIERMGGHIGESPSVREKFHDALGFDGSEDLLSCLDGGIGKQVRTTFPCHDRFCDQFAEYGSEHYSLP